MDYEFKEFRASDVVKVDILLSSIGLMRCPSLFRRSQSAYRGRAVVAKMREIISRLTSSMSPFRRHQIVSLRVKPSRRCVKT